MPIFRSLAAIDTLSFANNTFSSANTTFVSIDGPISVFSSSNDTFTNPNGNAIVNNSTINTFSITGSTFTGATSSAISIGTINTAVNISNSSFNTSSGSILYTKTDASTNIATQITNNTFSSGGSTGYATNISVSNGSICLDFTGNTAPTGAPDAYSFAQTGGTFDTTGDYTTTNTGDFNITGMIGIDQCTLP